MEPSECPSAGSKPEQREDPATPQDFMSKCWGYLQCVCVCMCIMYVKPNHVNMR